MRQDAGLDRPLVCSSRNFLMLLRRYAEDCRNPWILITVSNRDVFDLHVSSESRKTRPPRLNRTLSL